MSLRKLNIIADAIFNSVIRYGIAVYLVPTYEKGELKARKLFSETDSLQVLQNNRLRIIHGLRISDVRTTNKNKNDVCKSDDNIPHNYRSIQYTL